MICWRCPDALRPYISIDLKVIYGACQSLQLGRRLIYGGCPRFFFITLYSLNTAVNLAIVAQEDEPPTPSTPKLRDLGMELLPREKLFQYGRSALSDDELIALFLRTGVKGCNVLALSERLRKSAGSLSDLGNMEAVDIAGLLPGLGPAKAATLAAGFELGMRAVREQLKRADMKGAQNVYEYMVTELRYELQEVMCVLMLDSHNRLIRMERVAKGTLTRLLVHPRDLFRSAIRYNACRIVMVHNHPSGSVSPSEPDKQITKNIEAAGRVLCIPLTDHVIIGSAEANGGKGYFSFAEEGLLNT